MPQRPPPVEPTAAPSVAVPALHPSHPAGLPACLDTLEASLRDPLRVLENVAESITSVRSPEQQRYLFRAIKNAALMIERSSDAALDLIRCQYDVLRADISAFSLRSLLHEIRVSTRGAHERSPRMVQLRLPEHEVVIKGDRRRLVRVMSSLLAAIDRAMEEGIAITLSATWEEPQPGRANVELRISLPAQTLSPDATRILPSLSADLATGASAEDLEVQSAITLAPRLGATIRRTDVPPGVALLLRCPLVRACPLPSPDIPARASHNVSILLVDTPSRALRSLEGGLAESGYEPLRAQHRDDAIGLLYGRSPAAIVIATDSGSDSPLQFARHVRSTAAGPRIPILLVARDLSVPELSVARRYVDGVLIPPVGVHDMVRYLNGCLARDRRAAPREVELY